jgi:hypothetical protein
MQLLTPSVGRYTPVQLGLYVAEQANLFRPVIEKAALEVSILSLSELYTNSVF